MLRTLIEILRKELTLPSVRLYIGFGPGIPYSVFDIGCSQINFALENKNGFPRNDTSLN